VVDIYQIQVSTLSGHSFFSTPMRGINDQRETPRKSSFGYCFPCQTDDDARDDTYPATQKLGFFLVNKEQ